MGRDAPPTFVSIIQYLDLSNKNYIRWVESCRITDDVMFLAALIFSRW